MVRKAATAEGKGPEAGAETCGCDAGLAERIGNIEKRLDKIVGALEDIRADIKRDMRRHRQNYGAK